MTTTWLTIGGVLLMLVALFVVTDWIGRRYAIHAEVRRKILHFGTGFIGLSFAWLFDQFWPVAVLCSIAFAGLVALRHCEFLRKGVGASVHDVKRHSLGDSVVPLAIASLYVLADGERALYVAPMLLLTLADGSAALAAIRYGLSPFPTLDGSKTFEGTAVFFAVATWAVLVPLMLLTEMGREEVLLVTVVVALISTLVEATSWAGLDNVFVPWGSFFALRRCRSMSTDALLVELVVLVALAVVIFIGAREARLTVQAKFSVLLGTFVVWALVGWIWVAPAAMVMVLHPHLVPLPKDEAVTVDLRAVASVATCTLWVFLDQFDLARLDSDLYAFTVGMAAHLVMISVGRRSSMDAPRSPALHARWAACATLGVGGWYVVSSGPSLESLLFLGLTLGLVFGTTILFAIVPIPPLTPRSWVLQAYLGLQASAVAFGLHSLLEDGP